MKLPALELLSLQGERIALRAPAAPPRLLVFHRHDCGSCALLLPVIERVSRPLHGKGLPTLGVSQSDPEATLDVINEHGLCFPQLLDEGLALSRALAVGVVPTVVLAAGAGDVLDRADGIEPTALRRVVGAAAALCGASPDEVERVLRRLPALGPGSA